MNIGSGLMVGLSLLPIGLMQAWASVEHGMWYARSADFLQQPTDRDAALDAHARRHGLPGGVACFTWFMAPRSKWRPASASRPGPTTAACPAR
jgi:nitric oxide reductase subunit B